jgi:hypothetical protein
MNAFAGFSKGTSLFARFIEWAQKGRYSHAFFAFQYHGQWYVVDSTRMGIKIHKMAEFSNHRRMVKRYPVESTHDQARAVLELCVERSFDRYPMAEIFGNAAQLIVKWVTFGQVKIDNPFSKGERSPRCHELVAIILRDIYGYPITTNLDDTDLLWLDDQLKLTRR